jgi:signal transduction histidine kinase
VFLVWQPRVGSTPPQVHDEFIEHMAFQMGVAAACRLVLEGIGALSVVKRGVWHAQWLGGGVLLLLWSLGVDAASMNAWELANAATVGMVMLMLGVWCCSSRGADKAWIATLSALLLLFSLAGNFWYRPSSTLGLGGVFIYPIALIALWNLVSQRRRAMSRSAPAGVDVAERERQRIAQEVHDGVGLQLVTIISSLDPRDPQQQALVLSLERCLLELKLTVDSLHATPPGLLDGLAMLRYRLQPSLDRMGVSLQWRMEPHDAIDRLPPLTATHALRIAQEAIANSLRHAKARHLTVSCHVDERIPGVVLGIRDDGQGMVLQAQGESRGRGLRGMKRRAEDAGIRLEIDTAPGRGFAVDLLIPVVMSGAADVDEAPLRTQAQVQVS